MDILYSKIGIYRALLVYSVTFMRYYVQSPIVLHGMDTEVLLQEEDLSINRHLAVTNVSFNVDK